MAYQAFKITRLPVRVSLTISGKPVVLDQVYPIADQNLLFATNNVQYPAEPLDDFGYKIQPYKRAPWSDEIQYELNVRPRQERPSCVSGEVPVLSKSLTDITSLFSFADNSDRIRIDSISGINNNLMIQGQPVVYGEAYMIYDFIQVEWQAVSPSQAGASNNFSVINFTMGKKDEWGDSCSVQVNLLILAYISSLSSQIEQESPSFERQFNIKNGIPGSYTLVNIVSSGDYDNFSASLKDLDGSVYETFLSNTGDVLLAVPIDGTGKADVVLSGYPTLADPTDPYLHFIDVQILNSDGFEELVDPVNHTTTMYVTNDLNLLFSFNSILNVIMSNDEIGSVVDDYTQEVEAPSSVDIVAEVKLRSNISRPPYIYQVTQTSGPAVGGIFQQGDTSKFDITGMVGSVDPGSSFGFEASVTDNNNVTSKYSFSYTVLDIAVLLIPVVSAPVYTSRSINQRILEKITASNGPILSYGASYLPAGITLDTDTGILTGKIATAGDYGVLLRATNSLGVSVDFNWNILITAPVATDPPVITSSTFIHTPQDTGLVEYQLTYTGDEPITIVVTNVPSGWYWNSITKILYGTQNDIYEEVTFRLTNTAGVEEEIITFYRHP